MASSTLHTSREVHHVGHCSMDLSLPTHNKVQCPTGSMDGSGLGPALAEGPLDTPLARLLIIIHMWMAASGVVVEGTYWKFGTKLTQS